MEKLNIISQKIYGIDYKYLDYEEKWVVEKEMNENPNIGIQGGDYYKPIEK